MLKSLLTYWREVSTYLLDLIPCIISKARLEELEAIERARDKQEELLDTFEAVMRSWDEQSVDLNTLKDFKPDYQNGQSMGKFLNTAIPTGLN